MKVQSGMASSTGTRVVKGWDHTRGPRLSALCEHHIYIEKLALYWWCGEYHAGHIYLSELSPDTRFRLYQTGSLGWLFKSVSVGKQKPWTSSRHAGCCCNMAARVHIVWCLWFSGRIKLGEKQYTDAFNEELEAFRGRIRERAQARIEAAVQEYEEVSISFLLTF